VLASTASRTEASRRRGQDGASREVDGEDRVRVRQVDLEHGADGQGAGELRRALAVIGGEEPNEEPSEDGLDLR
jgi:hypothetical protein